MTKASKRRVAKALRRGKVCGKACGLSRTGSQRQDQAQEKPNSRSVRHHAPAGNKNQKRHDDREAKHGKGAKTGIILVFVVAHILGIHRVWGLAKDLRKATSDKVYYVNSC